jgi:hypothetical protein
MTRSVRVRAAFGAALAVAGVGLLIQPAVGAGSGEVALKSAQVYIIQGVPGASVDVDLDGSSVEKAVAAKAIIGPLNVSQGTHDVSFTSDDWSVSTTVNITKASTDLVLHWPADATDQPEATVFGNDIAAVAAGKARVTVAHTAVVPPADILAGGKVLFSNIANGEFVTAEVPADTYKVAVVPTGQKSDPLLGPLDLPVEAGRLTRVFAIGEPENGSMDAVVQVLPVGKAGSPAPGSVDAGSAGLVAGIAPAVDGDSSSAGSGGATSWVLVGLVAGGAAIAVTRARRRRLQ